MRSSGASVAPRPASASASRSAPSFAAQPPQSVSSVRRNGIGSATLGSVTAIARSYGYHRPGAVGPRWVPWSSKPVARHSVRRGGFDSHAFPPARRSEAEDPAFRCGELVLGQDPVVAEAGELGESIGR